jgi:hypothetical protein
MWDGVQLRYSFLYVPSFFSLFIGLYFWVFVKEYLTWQPLRNLLGYFLSSYSDPTGPPPLYPFPQSARTSKLYPQHWENMDGERTKVTSHIPSVMAKLAGDTVSYIAPLNFFLRGSTLPPPLPCVSKYAVYTYIVRKRGGGGYRVLGLRQITTCRKAPLQVNYFRWQHFPLFSMGLLFLRV